MKLQFAEGFDALDAVGDLVDSYEINGTFTGYAVVEGGADVPTGYTGKYITVTDYYASVNKNLIIPVSEKHFGHTVIFGFHHALSLATGSNAKHDLIICGIDNESGIAIRSVWIAPDPQSSPDGFRYDFELAGSESNTTYYAATNKYPRSFAWRHIEVHCVMDGVNFKAYLYVDGVLDAEISVAETDESGSIEYFRLPNGVGSIGSSDQVHALDNLYGLILETGDSVPTARYIDNPFVASLKPNNINTSFSYTGSSEVDSLNTYGDYIYTDIKNSTAAIDFESLASISYTQLYGIQIVNYMNMNSSGDVGYLGYTMSTIGEETAEFTQSYGNTNTGNMFVYSTTPDSNPWSTTYVDDMKVNYTYYGVTPPT